MAASEMENAQNAKVGRGDTVLVDGWFNSQQRTDAFGKRRELPLQMGYAG